MRAAEYGQHKASLMPKVMESYARLEARADLVIIEGAGSPAEVNLRQGDLANMGFAEEADVPVILVGDIDRGGVIASLVGTHAVLEPSEKQRIKGFLINKFRGDTSLFADGMDIISDRTGWLGLGILPWFGAAARLPAEDILDLETKSSQSSNQDSYHVAVPVIRRIANFDDLDPLSQDPSFRVTLVKPGEPLPLDADLVLLPGSKSTIADLQFLREQGWDQDLMTLRRHGKAVIGLCGGYQMLGKYIHDPDGIEGMAGRVDGLGLLDIETTLTEQKTLTHTTGIETRTGAAISGYEIHLGQTTGADTAQPMVDHIAGRDGKTADGAISPDGQVAGCYMHGLFASDTFRSAWLNRHGKASSQIVFDQQIDTTLDQLANHLAVHADLDAIARIAGL
jgi:adenosylcobyric acid synthase